MRETCKHFTPIDLECPACNVEESNTLRAELKQAIKERDEAIRQLVLVRNEYHAFFRKINNIE